MALISPGVEVTVIDESQYVSSAANSVPLVLLATATNKADPSGTAVAAGTTSANAGKLYQVTSQRDLVSLYGNPFFYSSTNGTPIQGYELNEYGLLTAYSILGVTNSCYVLRADIDLAGLVGRVGRPSGAPVDGAGWLDTTSSTWGIFEWNSSLSRFEVQSPAVITDSNYLELNGYPVNSLGNIGDYAVVAVAPDLYPANNYTYFYKTESNVWVPVGSSDWKLTIPTVEGTVANPTLTAGDTFTFTLSDVYGIDVEVPASPNDNVNGLVNAINSLSWPEISADNVNGKLFIYTNINDTSTASFIRLNPGTGTVLDDLGIDAGPYYEADTVYGTAAQMPLWGVGQSQPRPSGSIWIKLGSAGNGLNPVVKTYDSQLARWITENVTIASSDRAATASIDPLGGKSIPAGAVYGQINGDVPLYLWKRAATGPTVVTGTVNNPTFTDGPYNLSVSVSIPGGGVTSPTNVTISDEATAQDFVTAWSSAGIPYTQATVTTSGAIQLTHTEGGEIIISDYENGVSNGLLTDAGFIPESTDGVKYEVTTTFTFTGVQDSTSGSGASFSTSVSLLNGVYYPNTASFVNSGSGYAAGDTITILGSTLGGVNGTNDLILNVAVVGGSGEVLYVTVENPDSGADKYFVSLSNWRSFDYVANEGTPVADPLNGSMWYYSVADEVDIMVNRSGTWYGYKNVAYDSNGFPLPSGTNSTDPNGIIVAASEPTTQSDGTALVYGDLWLDTSDLENYPMIYRWQLVGSLDKWVLIDKTNQTDFNGILFADARWAGDGDTDAVNDPIPSISGLLTSNYIDLDCPDANLYPTGMLLFNTRRSGYNVKSFRYNYFNSIDFPDQSLPNKASTWVTLSGNKEDGSAYMGRKAQRNVVIESLRSTIDTNQDIRDEDNFFNLIAAPGYPELQPNMVVLNSDRGETAFIVGDTPFRLQAQATEVSNWARNVAGAVSTGEEGCVTRNTYMGLFYPSGIASELTGNLVTVPSSHMMLRTFLRNDQVAYPWFAAAGTRRGIIDNATNIGYIDAATGEFQTTKTSIGLRDVLYTNFINPMVFFTNQGLLCYGNKSSFDSSSAMDRINVVRLVAYLRRQLTLATRPFVFEPNDVITRKQVQGVIESLMVDLVAKRALYDFLVVCDESNNTPARIDRNELWIDVAIEPVKAAEFIYIPVRIMNTGEIKDMR